MRRPGRLIIICGLPGTGKTTLAKALAARHQGTIYSPDDWMDALGIDLWDSPKRDAIEALQWQQAQDLLRLGGTAIIEWGTWGRSERDILREGARALGAAAELHFLDAPPDILYERTSARGRENPPITLDELRTYWAAIERPTAEELALYDSRHGVPALTRKRVAILISGRGSNMSALIEAAKSPDYPAEIVGVFSNKLDAPGLDFARANGVPTVAVSHKDFASREAFDAVIDATLAEWRVDYVCLAGFMRIFSTGFAQKWTGKMLNIHPSLLPKYKGLRPHQQALDDGATVHGCTVHWVIPELDDGPTILQAEVPILPGDTADTLAARTLLAEHRIYPEALRLLATGAISAP